MKTFKIPHLIVNKECKISEKEIFKKLKMNIKNIEYIDENEGYYLRGLEVDQYQDELDHQEVWVNDKNKIEIYYKNKNYPFNNNGDDIKLEQNPESEKSYHISINFEKKYTLYAIWILFFYISSTEPGELLTDQLNKFKYNRKYYPQAFINKKKIPIEWYWNHWKLNEEDYQNIEEWPSLIIKINDFINILSKEISDKNEIIINNKSVYDIYQKNIWKIWFETPFYETGFLSQIESLRIFKDK